MLLRLLFILLLTSAVSACPGTSIEVEDEDSSVQVDTSPDEDSGTEDEQTSLPYSLSMASWNIRHMGAEGDARDWQATAEVLSAYDFVAIQESNSPEAVSRLEQEVEEFSGEEWSSNVDDCYGSGYFSECYAFIWRDAVVDFDSASMQYPDDDWVFTRPPYAARFTTDDDRITWTVVNIHVRWGGTEDEDIERRVTELRELDDAVQWFASNLADGAPVVLMGDFNLEPDHSGFDELDFVMDPVFTTGASTLSPADGKFANLLDNIWLQQRRHALSDAYIDPFPARLGVTHQYARENISDHAPVVIEVVVP